MLRTEVRRTLQLAIPVVLTQLGGIAMGIADTIMVGRLGPEPLSAVALGNSLSFTVLVVCMGAMLALDPMVSQAFGAGRHADCGKAMDHGFVLSTLLALPTMLLLGMALPILKLLRQSDELASMAASYIYGILPGVLPFLLFSVMRQFLQGVARPRPAMTIVILANVLNIFANWILIYGNLGAPALGATGAAWATTLVRSIMCIGLLFWMLRQADLQVFAFRLWPRPIEVPLLARMARLGFPVGLQFGLEVGVFASASVMMGWLGTLQLAGHQTALNICSTSFMIPMGFSSTAAVRVGHALGRDDVPGARRAAFLAYGLGCIFMATAALSFFFAPEIFVGVYTDDPELMEMGVALLTIGAIFQMSDGTQTIAIGALRGAADTRASMFVAFVAYWLVGLPLGWALAFPGGMGASGLWWGLTAGLTLVAITLGLRFLRLVRIENQARLRVAH
jgi:MATE family multidrug resistance protein